MLSSFLRVAAIVAAVPVAALLLLVALGQARPVAVAGALAAVLAAAVSIAFFWVRDQRVLARLLREVAERGTAPPPAVRHRVALPAAILSELDRLTRRFDERAALVERLLRAEETIVDRLPDPLIVLGSDRSVRRANAAAHAAFGADIPALLRHPGLRGAIERAQAAPGPQVAELVLPVPVTRELQATVLSMDSAIGGTGGVLAVLSDRTRERVVERMRADFVANASHELRTPLASLIGFIETLRGAAADDPPAQARFLAIMAEQAARMNRLIDDLLSLSRIELTEHQAPDERVDLTAIVQRIAAGLELRLAERRMRLVWERPAALPPVLGDATQLEQVAQNLIENAIKYGREEGRVTVGLSVAQGGTWPPRPGVVLAVADDGMGIARRHLPRLTERFYRVDAGRSRAVGGTGLGLAIVKHIVNRHRGMLAIESEEGVGSTFRVWLPQG